MSSLDTPMAEAVSFICANRGSKFRLIEGPALPPLPLFSVEIREIKASLTWFNRDCILSTFCWISESRFSVRAENESWAVSKSVVEDRVSVVLVVTSVAISAICLEFHACKGVDPLFRVCILAVPECVGTEDWKAAAVGNRSTNISCRHDTIIFTMLRSIYYYIRNSFESSFAIESFRQLNY